MIYKMNARDIKKLIRDFLATRYGKSIFVICYVAPFVLFMIVMGMFFAFLTGENDYYLLIILPFICMNIFCLGSYFFYKELRYFADRKK